MKELGTPFEFPTSDAAYYFRMAAEQGIAAAQYNLGICYLEGDGVYKNKSEAKKWFQKAAEQGYEDAQKALQYLEQQTNQNSSFTNNLSGEKSTIIDRSGHEETEAILPYSASTANSSSSVMVKIGRCIMGVGVLLVFIGIGLVFLSIEIEGLFNISMVTFLSGGALGYVGLWFFEKYDPK